MYEQCFKEVAVPGRKKLQILSHKFVFLSLQF